MHAEGGESGLEQTKRVQLDLIFINVKMPGLNGFTVCERFRAQEAFQPTPTILISAQSEATHRETGPSKREALSFGLNP